MAHLNSEDSREKECNNYSIGGCPSSVPSSSRLCASKFYSIRFLFRVLISIALLVAVYRFINVASLLRTFQSLSPYTAISLPLLYAVGQIISATKWRVFITSAGMKRSFGVVLRAYFLGMTANTFGLGTVGGDVSRGLLLHPEAGKRSAALATVVADRAHGLATLLTIGSIAIILVRPPALGQWALYISIVALIIIAMCWIWGPRLLVAIVPENHKFGQAARNAAHAFPRKLKPFLTASVISVIFHSLQISMHYLIAIDLHAPLSLAYLFAVIPLVNAASSLPISVNGIGVREALYVMTLIPAGATKEQAVAFGAIWLLCVTTVSIVGGLLSGISYTPTISSEKYVTKL